MAECSIDFEHATLNRWVAKFSPIDRDRSAQTETEKSDVVVGDETYIKANGPTFTEQLTRMGNA